MNNNEKIENDLEEAKETGITKEFVLMGLQDVASNSDHPHARVKALELAGQTPGLVR